MPRILKPAMPPSHQGKPASKPRNSAVPGVLRGWHEDGPFFESVFVSGQSLFYACLAGIVCLDQYVPFQFPFSWIFK